MVVLSIIVGVGVLVLSILIGYNLYQGGKEINNNKIRNAGLYWLIIIAVSLIISIVSYVNMKNALKGIDSERESQMYQQEIKEVQSAIMEENSELYHNKSIEDLHD